MKDGESFFSKNRDVKAALVYVAKAHESRGKVVSGIDIARMQFEIALFYLGLSEYRKLQDGWGGWQTKVGRKDCHWYGHGEGKSACKKAPKLKAGDFVWDDSMFVNPQNGKCCKRCMKTVFPNGLGGREK